MNKANPATTRWSPPPELTATLVLPDFHTPAEVVRDTLGKESDPTRMGIYLCLLDERPHLHPTLQALNVHRLRVHQLPSPSDPARDMPSGKGTEWTAWRLTETEEARRAAYLPHA